MNKSESKYFNTAKKMDKALIDLLEEKPFEYVTVSEICKKAGVNRSTFYLHYENTVDLLNEATRFLLDDFAKCFDVDTQIITNRFKDNTLEELIFISEGYLHPYLNYIKENRNIFLIALSRADSFGFNDIYQRLFDNIFNPILERFNYPTDDRKYVMMFYLNGITAIVTEWLKEDCKKTVEEVAEIIHKCIFGLNNIFAI